MIAMISKEMPEINHLVVTNFQLPNKQDPRMLTVIILFTVDHDLSLSLCSLLYLNCSFISDNVVFELKNKVRKKKGRGFQETSGRSNGSNDYERVRHLSEESDDDGESNFPQRCSYG